MKFNEVVSMLYRCMPNSDQIQLDEISERQINFTWRGHKFKVVPETLSVNTVDGRLLVGDDLSACVQMLLTKQMVMEKQK